MDTFTSAEEVDVIRQKKRSKSYDSADFVKDGLTTAEIRDTIMNIRNFIQANPSYKDASEDDVATKVGKEFPFFAKRYPMLFSMACKAGEFDFQSLEYFLNMRDNIISKKMTSEEASKQVGQEWFNKYVDTTGFASGQNKTI